MHAIILAGGFGTRLQSVVADVPKPLAPIAGKPFLVWLMQAMMKDGVTGFTLSVHHQWEKIRDYFDANPIGVPVDYAVEEAPLGTGGAIAYALAHCKATAPVIVVNGDTFVGVDYKAIYDNHIQSGAKLTMVLRHLPDTSRYGVIVTEGSTITSFAKGEAGTPGLINAGIYIVSPDLFVPYGLPPAFSFEQDFLLPNVKKLRPNSVLARDYFIDIGVPEDYARAQAELPKL